MPKPSFAIYHQVCGINLFVDLRKKWTISCNPVFINEKPKVDEDNSMFN